MRYKDKTAEVMLTSFICLALVMCIFIEIQPMVSLVLFLIFLMIVFYIQSDFFVTYFYIILYFATNVFGVYLIESSVIYLPEVTEFTRNVNALPMVTLIHIIFVETLMITFNPRKLNMAIKAPVQKNKNALWIYECIVGIQFVILFISFVRIAKYPALILGIDRFLYKQQYLSGFWGSISVLVTIFVPIDIMFYLQFKRKMGLYVLAMYFVYLFWIGTKFGLYLIAIYWLVIPFTKKISRKRVKKIILYFGILVGILLGLVSLQGKLIYNRSASENSQYLVDRIAQQGQMWWEIYKNDKGVTHPTEIGDETRTFFSSETPSDMNYGIYKLMKQTISEQAFYNKVYLGNTRYAFSTEASLYYYYGFWGLLLWTIVSASFYGWIINKYIRSFNGYRVITCLCLTRLFLTMNNVLLQSDFNKLFSYQTVIALFVIACLDFYNRRNKDGLRNRRNWV